MRTAATLSFLLATSLSSVPLQASPAGSSPTPKLALQSGPQRLFGTPRTFNFHGDLAVVVADFDGDGDPDLVVAAPPERDGFGSLISHGAFDLVLNRSGLPVYSSLDGNHGASALAAGDLNGDGILDVFSTNTIDFAGNLNNVLLGLGNAQFAPVVSYGANGNDGARAVVLADLDNDGDLDAVLPNGQHPYLNDGTGHFYQRFVGSDIQRGTSVAVGDVDHDGVLDIVTSNASSYDTNRHHVTLQLGSGDGYGDPGTPVAIPMGGDSVQNVLLADMDGDGNLDLLCLNTASADLSIALGLGNGTFQTAMTFPVHPSTLAPEPEAFVVADFDNDGKADVAVTSLVFQGTSSQVETTILRGIGGGLVVPAQLIPRFGTRGQNLQAVDIDQDGDVDLLTATHVLLNRLY